MTGRPLAFGGDQTLRRQAVLIARHGGVLSGDWLSPLKSDGSCRTHLPKTQRLDDAIRGHRRHRGPASAAHPPAGGRRERRAKRGRRSHRLNPTTSPDSVLLSVVPSTSFGAGGAGRLPMLPIGANDDGDSDDDQGDGEFAHGAGSKAAIILRQPCEAAGQRPFAGDSISIVPIRGPA